MSYYYGNPTTSTLCYTASDRKHRYNVNKATKHYCTNEILRLLQSFFRSRTCNSQVEHDQSLSPMQGTGSVTDSLMQISSTHDRHHSLDALDRIACSFFRFNTPWSLVTTSSANALTRNPYLYAAHRMELPNAAWCKSGSSIEAARVRPLLDLLIYINTSMVGFSWPACNLIRARRCCCAVARWQSAQRACGA
jgi:hypothetical protein